MNNPQLTLDRIFGDPDINGVAPKGLKFSPDGTSVTFLKSAEDNFEQLNLWSYDIDQAQSRLLVDASELTQPGRILSTEEKAKRERLRITQSGIVEYYWSPNADAILFPLDGNLYLYHLNRTATPTQLTDSETFETDIKFSPDGSHLSFVREQNLYIIDLRSSDAGRYESRQLTTGGGDVISYGLAEFIAQEEMHRYNGYWWSPDSKQIAFTRVDESAVELSQRFEIDADSFSVYDQRYPFAGTSNANVTVGVVDISSGVITWAEIDREKESYLCRVNWLQDSCQLAIQIQSRDQQHLDLVFWHCETGNSKVILSESSHTWVNLNNNFHSLTSTATDNKSDLGQFIWGSERTGFNHLYLINHDGTVVSAITQGNWTVSSLKGIDSDNNLFFDGYKDSVLERHLYRVNLKKTDSVTRITERGSSHLTELSNDKSHFIDHSSSALHPPSVILRNAKGGMISRLEPNKLDEFHPFFQFATLRGEVDYGELTADDGQTLHYRLIKPRGLKAGATCPVIISVYGGPGVQRVTNEWIPTWNHYMAQRGYGIMSLDNRGSSNRGKAFEDPIYHQLGEIEVMDQLKGLEFLQQLNWVDNQRIGVFGHSYGGYMTLMMMMKSTAFKAGVAVAPVTDWTLYDTHYTERYLAHPGENPEGYSASNVLPYADKLNGKLLLIHGMADDNVLYSNSTKLYKVLQDLNIEFEMMNYPGAKHGIAGRKTNIHRYGTMDRFFNHYLMEPSSPSR
ncbi:MAG: DPP IV N-terminal domain-containing protein [bacterium]|nr:S9 family peptidase [Gammaproteobacteria bacterium]HIL96754.1 S9 family peptidase [Pseudomonadales bacterium]